MKRSAWLVVALTALVLPSPAVAAFPGQNGMIAFTSSADGDSEIYSVNPDGTGLQQLTHNTVPDTEPAWSPDGQRIAFVRSFQVHSMNADGTGQALVAEFPNPTIGPSWSPDGQRIVFSSDNHCSFGDIAPGAGGVFAVNADGTGMEWVACGFDDGQCCGTAWSPDGTRLAWSEGSSWPPDIYVHTFGGGNVNLTDTQNDESELNPEWSPSGHKIAYTFIDFSDVAPDGVYTMNPDGSTKALLAPGADPAWSPDGTKIAVDGVSVMNADGTGSTFVTSGSDPSWQPIPINSYPRPQSASPARFSLVPAYQQCVSPNRIHGTPLAYDSCNPPVSASPYLIVATSESNGAPAAFRGHLRMKNLSGNPAAPPDEADAQLEMSVKDIRCNGNAPSPPSTCGAANQSSNPAISFPDYTGELDAVVFVRITDKLSTPHPGGPGAATVQEFDLHFPVACTGTASTALGSDCATATTVEALLPGAVTEGRRNVWALDRVHVRDGGPDGGADTPGNRIFLRPGVFVP